MHDYCLTRGFIASTRAFNLLTRTFNPPAHAFSLPTCAFNLTARAFSVQTREFKLVNRGSEFITRVFQLVTRRFELVTRGFQLMTRVLLFHCLKSFNIIFLLLMLVLLNCRYKFYRSFSFLIIAQNFSFLRGFSSSISSFRFDALNFSKNIRKLASSLIPCNDEKHIFAIY